MVIITTCNLYARCARISSSVGESGTKWYAGLIRRSGLIRRKEQMFLGQYQHSFDDKNRLTVPSRFREPIAGGAFVVQGLDPNLMVLTPEAFEIIYQRIM